MATDATTVAAPWFAPSPTLPASFTVIHSVLFASGVVSASAVYVLNPFGSNPVGRHAS